MIPKIDLKKSIVCIIGLGYVGLPLAEAFSKHMKVIGYDVDETRLAELKTNNNNTNLVFSDMARDIILADFIIICVPTPVTKSKEPDLTLIADAALTIARNIKRGSTVILESTVYPGVTEEVFLPLLEKESKLKCGIDFRIGYSPERINPGDDEHSIDKVTKIVAGMDEETTEIIAQLYSLVTPYIFQAKNIKTAEAAKVIENIQRDLNIALINELAIIFEKLGLSSKDIIDAAATKWNFHQYSPGLVGGHCIPVDPYYLVYKSRELGYHPQVIMAGRAINDHMPEYVAQITIKALNDVGKMVRGAKVLIAGLTYKEDVADIRETPARGVIQELHNYGVKVIGYDPLLNNIEEEFGIPMVNSLENVTVDAVIITVPHSMIKGLTPEYFISIMKQNPVLVDVRGIYDSEIMTNMGLHYRTL